MLMGFLAAGLGGPVGRTRLGRVLRQARHPGEEQEKNSGRQNVSWKSHHVFPRKFPVPFGRFDVVVLAVSVVALPLWASIPTWSGTAALNADSRSCLSGTTRTLGWRPDAARRPRPYSPRWEAAQQEHDFFPDDDIADFFVVTEDTRTARPQYCPG
jgi:hypothetical protein